MRLRTEASSEFRFGWMVTLHEQGRSPVEIAGLLQCSQPWVSTFLKRYHQRGAAALQVKKGTGGKPSRLTTAQAESLKGMLVKGALHYRFPTDKWTRERIAALVEAQFSVRYAAAHISRLMRRLALRCKNPSQRALKKRQGRYPVAAAAPS
jgi:transposase